MKKIILFTLTFVLVLASLLLCVSARNNDSYNDVMIFSNTDKSYPVMNSFSDAIGFNEYYGSNNLELVTVGNGDMGDIITIRLTVNNFVVTRYSMDSSMPPVGYTLTTVNKYKDVAICYNNGTAVIAGLTSQGYEKIIDYSQISIDQDFPVSLSSNVVTKDNLPQGKYVQFPDVSGEAVRPSVINAILSGITEFIPGLGAGFVTAFTAVFMTNGQLNALSITLLCFFGLALGYGIVRFITGLFRKET